MNRTQTTLAIVLGALGFACAPAAPPREVTPDPAELVAAPPPDGEVLEGGFVPVVLGRGSAAPHVFLIPEEDIVSSGEELNVVGEAHLATPGGFVVLTNAALTFNTRVGTVAGTATVPLPGFGPLEDLALQGNVQATVGFAPGAELDELGVPLADGRGYLFFNVITGGALVAGDITLDTAGPGGLVIVDPMDPAVFLSGSLVGVDKLGPLEDATIGLSVQGLIPFEPLVTPRDPADAFPEFDGNLLVMGTLEVPALPLTIVGDTVVNISGPLANNGEALLGANGELFLTQDLFGITVLEVELAEATAVVDLNDDENTAVYEGVPAAVSFARLPLLGELDAFRGFTNDGEGGAFEAEGDFVIDGDFLSDVLIVPMPDIPLASADLLADREGIHLGGPLAGELALPGVTVGAGAGAEAVFQPDLSSWEIRLSGAANVAGQQLLDQLIVIDADGVRVE